MRAHDLQKLLMRKSPTILTCVGAVGVISTSVLAGRATLKAEKVLQQAKEEKNDKLTVLETLNVALPFYIPAIASGVATIACIFGANALNQKHQAALISAYGVLDQSYKEYRAKVEELHPRRR